MVGARAATVRLLRKVHTAVVKQVLETQFVTQFGLYMNVRVKWIQVTMHECGRTICFRAFLLARAFFQLLRNGLLL